MLLFDLTASDILVLRLIEALRLVLGDVAFGSLIGATISLLVTISNNMFQARRESSRWQREKLYELYTEAQQSLTNLVRSTVINNGTSNSLADCYASLNALDRLKLVVPQSHGEVIDNVINELKEIQKVGGAAVPYLKKDEIAAIQERVTRLAQTDRRLNELFR